MSGTVYLLGDSTLDNLFWLEKSEDAIENQLTEGLKSHDYKVENLAYDGFTTQDVLTGGEIGEVLPKGGHYYKAYLEQRGSGKIKPLEKLKERVSEDQQRVTKDLKQTSFVVLSVGGNDFRVNLMNPLKLVSSISEIQKRYFQIIDQLQDLKSKNVKPILMFQYRTDAAGSDPYKVYLMTGLIGVVCTVMQVAALFLFSSLAFSPFPLSWFRFSGVCLSPFLFFLGHRFAPIEQAIFTKKLSMVVVSRLMESFYSPILERARKEKIPILDLPNTFNPYDKLYKAGIEPNKRGGKLIASGIKRIVLSYAHDDPSCLYFSKSGPDGFEKIENGLGGWKVALPSEAEWTLPNTL